MLKDAPTIIFLYGLLNFLLVYFIRSCGDGCPFQQILEISFNSQSNFNFAHHNLIFEKLSLYYIFPLPECNKLRMYNFFL